MQARLGEIIYRNVLKNGNGDTAAVKSLTHAMRRYCRSVELSNDYLRGYYGLKLVSRSSGYRGSFAYTNHRLPRSY